MTATTKRTPKLALAFSSPHSASLHAQPKYFFAKRLWAGRGKTLNTAASKAIDAAAASGGTIT